MVKIFEVENGEKLIVIEQVVPPEDLVGENVRFNFSIVDAKTLRVLDAIVLTTDGLREFSRQLAEGARVAGWFEENEGE